MEVKIFLLARFLLVSHKYPSREAFAAIYERAFSTKHSTYPVGLIANG